MNKTTSLYLDFARLATAMIVFLVHANYGRFTGGLPIICHLKFLGNDGVMVFFVLSGYVIAYVADCKETLLKDYAISRMARLYSVVVPGIVLTIILDYLGSRADFHLYDGWWFQADNPVWRISANLLFVNELWFSSVRLFSNGPFWSLGYEFWYYVIFGAYFYLEGRTRYLIIAASVLIAGPKIMLLFPIWLLGVLTYRAVRTAKISETRGWLLYLGSIAAYVLFQNLDGPGVLLGWSATHLESIFLWSELKWSYATPFLSDYVTGALVAIHFLGFSAISHRFSGLITPLGRTIHHLAGFTFAIYLFHYPLLQFFAAMTGGIASPSIKNAVILLGTLATIYALGTVTEMKKGEVKRWLITAFQSPKVKSAV